jgi:pimeloyl-ACP methyl ester carboxylesterase
MSNRRFMPILALVAMLAAACGGGGGGDAATDEDAVAPVAGQQVPAHERPVQFDGAGKVKLFGTFSMPTSDSAATVPGVLMIPTSGAGGFLGPAGVADPLGKDLAKSFTDAGVASYRYDQRGTGQSKLEPDVRLSFDDLVADAKAGLDLLAQRRETAGRDLSVVGYDQGGLVALRLAATDPRVKRVVLISTPGRSLVDVRAAQMQARYGPEAAAALRSEVANLLTTRTVPPLDQLRTEVRPLLPGQEANFLADLYAFDPAAEAAKVKAPTRIVWPRRSRAPRWSRPSAVVPRSSSPGRRRRTSPIP